MGTFTAYNNKVLTLFPYEMPDGRVITPVVDAGYLTLPTKAERDKMISDLQALDELGERFIELYNKDKVRSHRDDWEAMQRGEYPPCRKPKPTKGKSGYVYVIKEHMSGTYKIGRAKDYDARMNQFGVKLPFEWSTELVIKSADYISLETQLHHLFKDKRKNGEWFSLSTDDLSEIVETASREHGAELVNVEE